MNLTIDEKIELIVQRYDPDVLVDCLEITTEQLCIAFRDILEEKFDKFFEEDDHYGS